MGGHRKRYLVWKIEGKSAKIRIMTIGNVLLFYIQSNIIKFLCDA
jgi:hypothetical protein